MSPSGYGMRAVQLTWHYGIVTLKFAIILGGAYSKYGTKIFCNTLDGLLHHLQRERVKMGAGFV